MEKQPFLLRIRQTNLKDSYCIHFNDRLILTNGKLLDTLDILFKIFYIFNLEYPKELIHFYQFLELITNINTNVSNSCKTLNNILLSLDTTQ